MSDVTDYATAREALRVAERDLMLQREAVAEMRRSLPPGPVVDDYEFEGPDGAVRLSELFTEPDRPLVLYHFMYGKKNEQPCPMCSMWADGWAGVADHLAETVDFAVVTSAPWSDTATLAERREWTDLTWLSAAGSSFKLEVGGEAEEGELLPFVSVYRLDDGRPRLTYSGGAHIVAEHWRGVDLLSPVWHVLDLTPSGRGDWMPSNS